MPVAVRKFLLPPHTLLRMHQRHIFSHPIQTGSQIRLIPENDNKHFLLSLPNNHGILFRQDNNWMVGITAFSSAMVKRFIRKSAQLKSVVFEVGDVEIQFRSLYCEVGLLSRGSKMGLGFSGAGVKDTAHWSYSGFKSFRCRLAKEIGVDIYQLWNGHQHTSDDILPLLDHSDCDGILTPAECAKVAPRLRQLVDKWNPRDFDQGYDRENAIKLANHMDKCVSENVNLIFC